MKLVVSTLFEVFWVEVSFEFSRVTWFLGRFESEWGRLGFLVR